MKAYPFAAAILALSFATPALAQNFDGTWNGRIMCDALPDTPGRLNQALTLQIAGGRLSYQRAINLATGEATSNMERGEGPVGADGAVNVTGNGVIGTNTYRATYTGRITGQTMELTGTQVWRYGRRNVAVNRNCTITATRGR